MVRCLKNTAPMFLSTHEGQSLWSNRSDYVHKSTNNVSTYFVRCVALITRVIAEINFLKNIVSMYIKIDSGVTNCSPWKKEKSKL